MFLLLTSNILFHTFFKVSIVDLEKHVFVCWESSLLNGLKVSSVMKTFFYPTVDKGYLY